MSDLYYYLFSLVILVFLVFLALRPRLSHFSNDPRADDLDDYELSDDGGQNISLLDDVEPLEQYNEVSMLFGEMSAGSGEFDPADTVEGVVGDGPETFPDLADRELIFGHGRAAAPLNARGFSADDKLTREQQWMYLRGKRATDGAVRTTSADFTKNFKNELDDVANRRWWDVDGMETDYSVF